MLLLLIMILCQIVMEGYTVKHDLSYQQFTNIINKLSFHNSKFDKNFMKYYCKKLKENYARLLKLKKKRRLLVTFWNQFFLFTLKEISTE